MINTRIERDSMGEVNVPTNALYGAQTQRAIDNFPVSGQPLPIDFIKSLLLIKSAAAEANLELGLIPENIATAICTAVNQLQADKNIMQHFPVDIYQTGSGTSSNMNANEVIAHLASIYSQAKIDANDHVNYGQSSNDVIPSAIHVSAAILVAKQLLPALHHLQQTIVDKALSLNHLVKTGRTHLMDAMPVRMSQSLFSWAAQISANIDNIKMLQPRLQQLAQGGTAVGTGINAHPDFANHFNQKLSGLTGITFSQADNFSFLMATQDTAVALSGQLKTTAVSLMKIANDLRWMNSGPLAGLGEISLPVLQPGSSIMPGKVNPIIPESSAMVAAQVIGNDAAITIGGQSGNFELNVMLPMIATNLISSINLLTSSSRLLADKAIASFEVQEQQLTQALHKNPILVTALNPLIGYLKAAEIAKQAYREQRPIIDVAEENTGLTRQELEKLLDPARLTRNVK
ncbi:lyase family protein [Moritella sp. F3]|uniref:class II fumarate hydratase n=1 Tax=Moritella sp. F3 TaxID=2718882 RepID=UPI0018E13F9E|nr:class II fumarate hydratase [Moritella sp. F3]GIC78994.1 fumarate hydratase class II [Moritella sp. F1]GIC83426.1 fumarate hydratase class II [Moritella sp. F3]